MTLCETQNPLILFNFYFIHFVLLHNKYLISRPHSIHGIFSIENLSSDLKNFLSLKHTHNLSIPKCSHTKMSKILRFYRHFTRKFIEICRYRCVEFHFGSRKKFRRNSPAPRFWWYSLKLFGEKQTQSLSHTVCVEWQEKKMCCAITWAVKCGIHENLVAPWTLTGKR